MKERRGLIIWPEYFDLRRTRSEGRRVSKRSAVKSPKAVAVAEAAKELGLDSTVDYEVAYPRSWWAKGGRVIVERKWSKAETIRRIADRLKSLSK